ncbi:MAG: PCRF domain-containing protein, partial [Burkholderiaceae bacterium]
MIKPSLLTKLQQIQERFAVVESLLSSPDSANDLQQFRALSKERSDLAPVVEHFGELQRSERDLKEAEAWLTDPDLKEFG